MKEEIISNVLVKSMTQFPSPQFSLAMHLINPTSASTGELHEAIKKLRDLNNRLEGAQYANFWDALDDDFCADLIAEVLGFKDLIREKIAMLISQAFREVALEDLDKWLGLNSAEKTKKVVAGLGWSIEGNMAKVPSNPDNEAQKAEIREEVSVDMFARVMKRSWEGALST